MTSLCGGVIIKHLKEIFKNKENDMKENIKISKMVYNDYLTFGALTTGLILLAIFIYSLFATTEPNLTITYIFSGIAAVMLIFSVIRLFVLNHLIHVGVEVKATITAIYFYRGRGKVSFEFSYEQQIYKSGWTVVRNAKTKTLRDKKDINILINPNKPKQAIILNIF